MGEKNKEIYTSACLTIYIKIVLLYKSFGVETKLSWDGLALRY